MNATRSPIILHCHQITIVEMSNRMLYSYDQSHHRICHVASLMTPMGNKQERLLAGPLEVRLPPFGPVTLRLVLDLLLVRLSINPPSDDDDITSAVEDDLFGRPVLLTHLVALDVQSNTGREDHEILIFGCSGRMFLVDTFHGDETEDETLVPVSSSHLDGLSGVFPRCEVALAGHFGEKEETPVERLADGGETGDDAITRNGVGVGDMRPRCDLVDTRRVLQGDGVA